MMFMRRWKHFKDDAAPLDLAQYDLDYLQKE
jgi:hypothetical protein